MNLDPAMTTGYVVVAVGGFGLGALAGRWMMAEMRSALSAVQLRLSALEQKVTGYSAAPAAAAVTANGNSASPVQQRRSRIPLPSRRSQRPRRLRPRQ